MIGVTARSRPSSKSRLPSIGSLSPCCAVGVWRGREYVVRRFLKRCRRPEIVECGSGSQASRAQGNRSPYFQTTTTYKATIKPTLNVSISKHLNAFSCCLLFLYNTMSHSSLLGSQEKGRVGEEFGSSLVTQNAYLLRPAAEIKFWFPLFKPTSQTDVMIRQSLDFLFSLSQVSSALSTLAFASTIPNPFISFLQPPWLSW